MIRREMKAYLTYLNSSTPVPIVIRCLFEELMNFLIIGELLGEHEYDPRYSMLKEYM